MAGLRSGLKRLWRRATASSAERRHALVGPAAHWELKRDFQIAFLRERGLQPQHRLLDIGCGTLRGGVPLIDYLEPGHYCGLEAREEVLEEGRAELQEAGLTAKAPILICSQDITQASVDMSFDFAWAFSVLIHMSDDISGNTLDFVAAHLTDAGVFYANVNVGVRAEGAWQGFPVVWRSLAFYEEACSTRGLQLEEIGSLRELGHLTGIESQDAQRMLAIKKAGA